MLATYQRTDLFQLAVQAAAGRLDRVRRQHHDELQVVQAELRAPRKPSSATWWRSRPAPGRHRPRPPSASTHRQTAELQHRQAELTAAIDHLAAQPPSQAILAHLRDRIHAAVTQEPMPAKKALVQALFTKSASKAAT